MATDVNVQYFSHLNGLALGNNWGGLIRLLDKTLVTGIDFTQITAASIDEQGDVHITLYAAHNAMLFQVVELTGFTPTSLNQKYRIKGVPSTTELILKPHTAISETSVTIVGSGKLAPLGYDIIFRDANDVKRVYRAKNPTAQHPFIRIDESLTSPDGTTGVYSNTYNLFAMVGLLERMDHIDDFEDPSVQQLPFDPTTPAKNWNIVGTGGSVIRGWSRWYYASRGDVNYVYADTGVPISGLRPFTLVGDSDSFLINRNTISTLGAKAIIGCGLFRSTLEDIAPSWFLASCLNASAASTSRSLSTDTGGRSVWGYNGGYNTQSVFMLKLGQTQPAAHVIAVPILPDNRTGYSGIYNGTEFSALEVPVVDQNKVLRGVLPHTLYLGANFSAMTQTYPYSSGSSMYVIDSVQTDSPIGSTAFYLGELE
ncbi:hypothetical protein [Acinetobacter sp. CS-2]|uniref:hypothetical protein n=1 Tax=Acinetobacter sp. CS-2 TaxID=2798861 RepID=UPI001904AD31|nr:hypothetical protein [Acinetobacter sp. CS-2]QQN40795.1 hypothetical protein JFY49_07905 [Acinetobacter sp. CS-2]